jgi:DNA polymerase-3 subunit alpha
LRFQYLSYLDQALQSGQHAMKERLGGQISMFAYLGGDELKASQEDELPPLPEYTYQEMLALEKDLLGFYISGHPLNQYRQTLEDLKNVTLIGELSESADKSQVTLAGMISSSKTIYTKKGRPMSFLTLEDFTGELEVIVFSDLYERHQKDLEDERVILIKGQLDLKEEDAAKVLCEEMIFLPRQSRRLVINLSSEKSLPELMTLKNTLSSARGGTPVYLHLSGKEKLILTGDKYWVEDSEILKADIERLLGAGSVTTQQLTGA